MGSSGPGGGERLEAAARRAFVVVIDALGAGAEADAADYGDGGADTLRHLATAVGGLRLPTLERLGLGCIARLRGVVPSRSPVLHGTLHHQGPGKDSTTGHWELFGVVASAPLPTYPGGLPRELVARLEHATGRGVCGGAAIDGLAAIAQLGERHLRTGELIAYTSVDSVVQLAAHEDVVSRAELEDACAAARGALTGDEAVGRVIARPFRGTPGAFERTAGRRDFALAPPERSHLDALGEVGVPVHAVGKVGDLFTGRGIDVVHPGATNAAALASIEGLVEGLDRGVVIANLVETDELYGHRKDVEGFHAALREIDAAIGRWLAVLRPADMLIVTADHGVDPAMAHADHTRERVPLLASFAGHGGRRHEGPMADVGASVLSWTAGRRDPELPGEPFA
ncbi:MAG: phosphopentomutase [Solirubrobacteraceae bacterium]|nr:phosphopentomutase [Solirubrobacteraceae bacterium]